MGNGWCILKTNKKKATQFIYTDQDIFFCANTSLAPEPCKIEPHYIQKTPLVFEDGLCVSKILLTMSDFDTGKSGSFVFIPRSKTFYSTRNIYFSNYILYGFYDFLFGLMLRDCLFENSHMVCVGYQNKKKIASDAQWGVTGKCKIGESALDAAARECFEETSLYPQQLFLIHQTSDVSWFAAHISDCTILSSSDVPINHHHTHQKDSNYRVCIFIYGHYLDIVLKLHSISLFSKSKDSAAYLGIVRVSSLLNGVKNQKITKWCSV